MGEMLQDPATLEECRLRIDYAYLEFREALTICFA